MRQTDQFLFRNKQDSLCLSGLLYIELSNFLRNKQDSLCQSGLNIEFCRIPSETSKILCVCLWVTAYRILSNFFRNKQDSLCLSGLLWIELSNSFRKQAGFSVVSLWVTVYIYRIVEFLQETSRILCVSVWVTVYRIVEFLQETSRILCVCLGYCISNCRIPSGNKQDSLCLSGLLYIEWSNFSSHRGNKQDSLCLSVGYCIYRIVEFIQETSRILSVSLWVTVYRIVEFLQGTSRILCVCLGYRVYIYIFRILCRIPSETSRILCLSGLLCVLYNFVEFTYLLKKQAGFSNFVEFPQKPSTHRILTVCLWVSVYTGRIIEFFHVCVCGYPSHKQSTHTRVVLFVFCSHKIRFKTV